MEDGGGHTHDGHIQLLVDEVANGRANRLVIILVACTLCRWFASFSKRKDEKHLLPLSVQNLTLKTIHSRPTIPPTPSHYETGANSVSSHSTQEAFYRHTLPQSYSCL